MTAEALYSIRMRASTAKKHISGAERISHAQSIDDIVTGLLARARSKGVPPDTISITVESLQGLPVRFFTALDVLTVRVPDMHIGRTAAARTLAGLGVSDHAVTQAIALLSCGASPADNTMRGAIIMDARTGERLEPDQERGVRASRFDYTDDVSALVDERLAALGLTHYRTREALALATKIVHAPCVIAELCWSDDPDYTAGYVASLLQGYVRFPHLKSIGDPKGGRILFVDSAGLNRDALIVYLQKEPVLISSVGRFHGTVGPDEYCTSPTQRS